MFGSKKDLGAVVVARLETSSSKKKKKKKKKKKPSQVQNVVSIEVTNSLVLFFVFCGKNVIKMKLKTNTNIQCSFVLYVCYGVFFYLSDELSSSSSYLV